MKRSMINELITGAKRVLAEYQIHLPPFAYWSPEEWATKGEEFREIPFGAIARPEGEFPAQNWIAVPSRGSLPRPNTEFLSLMQPPRETSQAPRLPLCPFGKRAWNGWTVAQQVGSTASIPT